MTSRLNPYLHFNGDARAAMEFYRSVLGGELVINTFGESGGMADPAVADKVMHAQLETDAGYTLMGADIMPGMPFSPGTTMTVCLSGDDSQRLHEYWSRLADGASVNVPLEKQMWGDEFGQLTDRFGVPWMVNIGQPQG
jgi:PhnB protein